MRLVRPSGVLLLASLLVTAVACTDAKGPSTGEIDVAVDLQAGQTWTATGPSVGDGLVCAGGSRRFVEFTDPDGSTLAISDVGPRLGAAAETGRPAAVVFIVEMTCRDGSGTFTLAEDPQDETWEIRSGRGSYAELTGGGAQTVTFFDASSVESSTPDDPPDGAPVVLHLTGEVTRPISSD